MGAPLLLTKLSIPPPGPLHLSRARLLALLALRDSLRLALVAAPAGFGKSTLLAEWARDAGQQGVAVAWYTLDPTDDDPLRFLAYLTHALAGALGHPPALVELVQGLLRNPQTVPEAVLTELLNALILAGRPCLLILDDYHRIGSPAIHTAVSFLLEHLPAGVCLALGTRADPPLAVARLRARGQLAELRAADLRFTRAELDTFLAGAVQTPLAEVDLQQIDAVAEGWAASIQLIALALERPAPARATTVYQVLAPHASGQRQIFDYLAEEVFAQQPPGVQRFLLATSVLERMCAELCDTVVKDAGGRMTDETRAVGSDQTEPCILHPSSLILHELERTNLFLIPLDDERRWYRYHHLFAGFLRERLRREHPDLIPELHRRASAWFAGQVASGDLPASSEAVQHALAAREFTLAARLIDQTVTATLARGELALLLSWLAALPPEMLQERPHLALTQARGLLLAGQFAAAEQRLDWVAQRLPTDAPLHGDILAHRATIAAVCGASTQALGLAAAARTRVAAGNQATGARIAFAEAMAHFHRGDLPAADRACAETMRLAQAAGQFALALEAAGIRSIIALVQGRLHTADRHCAEAITLAEAHGLAELPAVALVHLAQASVHYEWDQLPAAERHVRQGIALRQRGGLVGEKYLEHPLLALVLAARGDRAGAAAAVAAAAAIAPTLRSAPDTAMIEASLARVALLLGDMAAARRWADRTDAARVSTPVPQEGVVGEHEALQLARAWLALGRTAEATALAQACSASARTGGRTGHQIAALTMVALAEPAQSRAALAEALRLAAPEGYVRTFVDLGQPMRAQLAALRPALSAANDAPLLLAFCDQLLAAFGEGMKPDLHPASRIPHPLAEPLSERELEVLRLLVAGLTNAAIAGRLVIALPTVKTHLAHIYQKLGVNQRDQAVELARALSLI